ncbi:MAG TPA: hypothetical protein VIJ23_16290 [Mycobacterium sp.]
MTGYLSALVSSARGSAAQLRPRPIARFEAPTPGDPAASVPEIEEHVDTQPRPTIPHRSEPARIDDLRAAETHPERERPRPGYRADPVEVRHTPAQAAVATEPRDLEHRYRDAPAEHPYLDIERVDPVIHRHETQRIEQVGMLSPTTTPVETRHQETAAEQQHPASDPKSQPAHHIPSERGVLNPPALPPQLGQPTHPMSAKAAKAALNPATVRPDPIVHVTIGRLEVRASPAAPVPAVRPGRGSNTPKILSLDDYGAQRRRS